MNYRLLAATALLGLLTACGGGVVIGIGEEPPPPPPRPQPNPVPNPPTLACSPAGTAAAALTTNPAVCMLTSSGEMVIELFPVDAPVTVANFLAHVNSDFYDQTLIHRVDRDFVAQGGGFRSGMIPKSPPFAPIQLEDNTTLSNLRYTISMARRSDPNSATSEWFFNTANNTSLDGIPGRRGYAVFGWIISGRPVLDAINIVPVYRYSDTDIQPRTEILVYWAQRIQ